MTRDPVIEWERHEGGSHLSVPISYGDVAEVREWCRENCRGDYLISLGRCVVFQSREDAALATLWWRREE